MEDDSHQKIDLRYLRKDIVLWPLCNLQIRSESLPGMWWRMSVLAFIVLPSAILFPVSWTTAAVFQPTLLGLWWAFVITVYWVSENESSLLALKSQMFYSNFWLWKITILNPESKDILRWKCLERFSKSRFVCVIKWTVTSSNCFKSWPNLSGFWLREC